MAALNPSASIGELKQLFSSLPVPAPDMRQGFFRARFVGPFWYRPFGFPGTHLAGLPFWQGKKFLTGIREFLPSFPCWSRRPWRRWW